MPNRCYVCKEEEETSNHILLHYLKARILWQLIFALFDVQWVMNSLVRGLLLNWGGSFVGRKRKKGLESCSFIYFLDHLEGKKYESL